jgi:hypothetical protein
MRSEDVGCALKSLSVQVSLVCIFLGAGTFDSESWLTFAGGCRPAPQTQPFLTLIAYHKYPSVADDYRHSHSLHSLPTTSTLAA